MAKKTTKKKSAKSAKDELAANAAEIRRLEKEQKAETKKPKAKAKTAKAKPEPKPAPEPVEIPDVTRAMHEIVQDRVQVLEGSIGLKIADETPIEESLVILDWAMQMNDHVGFMIGDVLNFGEVRWGDKYTAALNQTGRALSTLKAYSEVARRIPAEKRVGALSFSHHREILRLPDEKMDDVLKDLEKEADKKDGHLPTRDELRHKIQTLTPRKKPKRATSGKGRKGKKSEPELPPYEPTDAERETLEEGELAVEETAKLLKPDGKLFKVLVRMDNKTKQRWLGKLDSIVLFFKDLTNNTGY